VDVTSTDSDKRRNTYNGIEAGFSARFGNGGTAFGGWSMERTVDVKCDSTWDPNTLRFCDQSDYGMPWRHEYKLAGAYPLPLGLQVSTALVSWAGIDRGGRYGENGVIWAVGRTTRYAADCVGPCTPGALVIPSLTVTTLNLPLVQPGTLFNERWTQVDLGIRRSFKFGEKSLNADLQAFNAFNTAVIRTANNTFGSSLGRPTATLDGRVVRLTITFKF
jgi:outer membrane receptor protein involved in Fe transport